jgi:hypothetical protein
MGTSSGGLKYSFGYCVCARTDPENNKNKIKNLIAYIFAKIKKEIYSAL